MFVTNARAALDIARRIITGDRRHFGDMTLMETLVGWLSRADVEHRGIYMKPCLLSIHLTAHEGIRKSLATHRHRKGWIVWTTEHTRTVHVFLWIFCLSVTWAHKPNVVKIDPLDFMAGRR